MNRMLNASEELDHIDYDLQHIIAGLALAEIACEELDGPRDHPRVTNLQTHFLLLVKNSLEELQCSLDEVRGGLALYLAEKHREKPTPAA